MGKKRKSKITPFTNAIKSNVVKPSELKDDTLKFSFKHLDFTNPKFHIKECKQAYFYVLIERLKHISGLRESELRNNHSDGLRSHPIKWDKTTEPKGFKLKGQLKDCIGWQFELTSNKYGRVHGFLLNGTFYVVWFDPEHKLYAPKK